MYMYICISLLSLSLSLYISLPLSLWLGGVRPARPQAATDVFGFWHPAVLHRSLLWNWVFFSTAGGPSQFQDFGAIGNGSKSNRSLRRGAHPNHTALQHPPTPPHMYARGTWHCPFGPPPSRRLRRTTGGVAWLAFRKPSPSRLWRNALDPFPASDGGTRCSEHTLAAQRSQFVETFGDTPGGRSTQRGCLFRAGGLHPRPN